MPINWNKLENEVESFLKNDSKKQLDSAMISYKLATLFGLEALNGQEQFGNKVMAINIQPLAASLKKAYDITFKLANGSPFALNMMGINGVIISWLSAAVSPAIPPPGAVGVVSNLIVFPGAPIFMNIQKDTKTMESDFAKEYVKALKRQASTVTGMCIALVPAPPAPPIPIPFLWVGIS